MIDFSYLDKVPDTLVELYAQVETDILNDMAERISAMDFYSTAVQWQEQKLQQMGLEHNVIVKKLSALTGKTEKELDSIINACGGQVLASNAWLQDYGYSLANMTTSAVWQARLKAGLTKTGLLFENLTATTASTSTRLFENALDRAYMQIESGAFSRTEAVRNAVKDLSAKGLRTVEYHKGQITTHTDNIDVAVRRAVLTGVNQTTAQLQLTVNEELGLDLVEVSAHAGARPSHAEWQGRIYSLSGKDKKYRQFESATGYGTGDGLCGWNCRHTFYPWIEGAPRVWTDKELAKLEDKTVSYNGKQYTDYEASQIQRYYEREIRKWKREASALESAGCPNAKELDKVTEYNQRLDDFCRQTGYKKQYDRTYVVSGQISKTPPAPPKPKFIPAKDISEAESAISKIMNANQFGAVGVSYKGVGLDVANAINERLLGLYDKYKVDEFGGIIAPSGNTRLGKLLSGAHMGYSPIGRSFMLNRKTCSSLSTAEKLFNAEADSLNNLLTHPERYDWNKMSRTVRECIERSKVSGRATVPKNLQEAITHEFGHSLERSVKKHPDWAIAEANMATYADRISGYAGESIGEYIAESFASFEKGETFADPVLVNIFKALMR